MVVVKKGCQWIYEPLQSDNSCLGLVVGCGVGVSYSLRGSVVVVGCALCLWKRCERNVGLLRLVIQTP